MTAISVCSYSRRLLSGDFDAARNSPRNCHKRTQERGNVLACRLLLRFSEVFTIELNIARIDFAFLFPFFSRTHQELFFLPFESACLLCSSSFRFQGFSLLLCRRKKKLFPLSVGKNRFSLASTEKYAPGLHRFFLLFLFHLPFFAGFQCKFSAVESDAQLCTVVEMWKAFFSLVSGALAVAKKNLQSFSFDGAPNDELLDGERAEIKCKYFGRFSTSFWLFASQSTQEECETEISSCPSPQDKLSPASFPITNEGKNFVLLFSESTEAISNSCNFK
jgi:hypothetical protein